jgi:formylglycine-generating enzyme required for sulfatase activity
MKFMTVGRCVAPLFLAACAGEGAPAVTFDSADTPGDVVSIGVGSESVHMIYANSLAGITFPFSPSQAMPVDDQTETLSRQFFLSETQVTNALMAEVLRWAHDHGRFSVTAGDHNGIDATTAKHGTQQLLDLDDVHARIHYSSGSFTVDPGFENHPVVSVSWYGAIMFCNWLTEMRDGNADQVVYTGFGTTWDHVDTVEHADRTGYRLPSNEEWEFAARFVGTTAPTAGDLASTYIAQNLHGGNAFLTAGYCWTPAAYASGATRDYHHEDETRAVAWYAGDAGMDGVTRLMTVGQKAAGPLGLHDMSGNVWEWCSSLSGVRRVVRGGAFYDTVENVQVGIWGSLSPNLIDGGIGFRFARTQ